MYFPLEYTIHSACSQVLFLANYHDINGEGQFVLGTDVLWSLAVEEHFGISSSRCCSCSCSAKCATNAGKR